MKEVPFVFELRGVSLRVNGREVLSNINLGVKRGTFLGIVGPNGAGKTTLLRVMLGITKPTSGEVLFFGEPLERDLVAKKVGYVPQRVYNRNFFPLTVEEVVRVSSIGCDASLERFSRLLDMLGISHLLKRRISELSGGEFQRVLICSALARDPEVLLLDEPNTGVDSVGQESFYRLLKELNGGGLTIVMVSHDIGTISSYVDEVACLNRKLYFHGKPGAEFERSIVEAYGGGVDLLEHGERCEEGKLGRRGLK